MRNQKQMRARFSFLKTRVRHVWWCVCWSVVSVCLCGSVVLACVSVCGMVVGICVLVVLCGGVGCEGVQGELNMTRNLVWNKR